MSSLYCIDTSSLLKLKDYPRDVFPSLWMNRERLISEQRIIAPREVLRELVLGDDEIARWAKQNRVMFLDVDDAQATTLREILQRFPALSDHMKAGPHADPLLVALTLAKTRENPSSDCMVVTEERLRGKGSLRIPSICVELGIRAITLLDFLRQEGLSF